jgi:hypothetical protein
MTRLITLRSRTIPDDRPIPIILPIIPRSPTTLRITHRTTARGVMRGRGEVPSLVLNPVVSSPLRR